MVLHRAVASDVFELVRTLEFDVVLNGEKWPTRVELYQSYPFREPRRCAWRDSCVNG